MSKFYAVKIGKVPGIYVSWPECQKQTKGFSGAIFKSFSTRLDALEYLYNGDIPIHEKQFIHEKKFVGMSLIGGIAMKADGREPSVVVVDGKQSANDTNKMIEIANRKPGQLLYDFGNITLPRVDGKKFLEYDRSVLNTPPRFTVIYLDGSKRPSVKHKGSGAYARFDGKDYSMSLPFTNEIAARYNINHDDVNKLSSPTLEYLALSEVCWRFISFRVKEVVTETISETGQKIITKSPQKLDPPVCILFVSDYLGVKSWTDGSWTPEKDYIIKIRDSIWAIIRFLKDKGVHIGIKHVNGHVGVFGNELSDIAAKSTVFHDTIPQLVADMTNKFL